MSDEPEFDDAPYRGTQILWGRVVVLLLALALAFWLGTTFGGDASARAELEDKNAEITKLESQIASLEAEVAAVDAGGQADDAARSEEAGGGGRDATEDKGDGDDAADQQDDRDASEGAGDGGDNNDERDEGATEYVVQSGDSLASIAQEVYGDPTLWREIATANDLSEPYALTVGDTLDIPEQP